jgi:hypothetical protein
VQVAVVFGGLQSANQIHKWVKAAQNKQKELVKDIHGKQTSRSKASSRVAVNEVFFKRLCTILSM